MTTTTNNFNFVTFSNNVTVVNTTPHGLYKPDKLTNYFEEIRCNVDYKRWLCGHYHDNKAITIKDIVLYEQIVRIA